MVKFELKGLEKLQEKLKKISERAEEVDGEQIDVEGGLTPENEKKVARAVSDHVLRGKPMPKKL